ncbi:hypothetical protein ACN28E_47645 [Archangium lansingense]|uniref:hypothetical protein n=1 Tax=Archangium lansingense TaxID=2995310 RepID=UPI003B7C3735
MDQKTSKPYPLKIEVPWCERCGRFMDVTVRHVQTEGCSTPTLEMTVRCPGAGKRKSGHTQQLMSYGDDVARDPAARQAAADELLAALVHYVGMLHR